MHKIGFLLSLIVLGVLLSAYLPWWGLPILGGLLAAVWNNGQKAAFWLGLLAGALVYLVLLLLSQSGKTGLVAEKMGDLFEVGPVGFNILTIFIGALPVALASWLGQVARDVFSEAKTVSTT